MALLGSNWVTEEYGLLSLEVLLDLFGGEQLEAVFAHVCDFDVLLAEVFLASAGDERFEAVDDQVVERDC